MLSKPSSIKKGELACQLLGNVDMHTVHIQNVIKIYQAVLGLRVFSLTDHE